MQRRNLAFLPLILLVGCGGGDPAAAKPAAPSAPAASNSEPAPAKTETKSESSSAAASSQKWDGSQGVAEVTGVVSFSGTAPARAPLDMSTDPTCHAGGEHLDETVIVNDGKLQNVFVYVSKGTKGWEFDAPSDPVVLNQEGCLYKPHVLGVQEGQMLEVRNSDAVTHNVHTYSRKNSPFNKSQPAGAEAIKTEMKRDENQFAVKCDIHSWMGAFVTVVDNPFFDVSGADGSFSLGKLPPGEYTITAKHETLGEQEATITVSDSGVDPIQFTFGN